MSTSLYPPDTPRFDVKTDRYRLVKPPKCDVRVNLGRHWRLFTEVGDNKVIKNADKQICGNKAHNAEATYTCGHCSKPVEDTEESMECEYCNLWYHTACEKIKHSDYEML